MNRLILLFFSIPLVFSAESKCPKYFTLTTRNATAENNHTSEWCLGVFPLEYAGYRPYARGWCAHYNSTLSLPENNEEFRALSYYSKVVNKNFEPHFNRTIPNLYIAVDGEYTPKCKALMMRKDIDFEPRTDKGDCGLHKNLYSFDDSNTDPTFAIDLISGYKYERKTYGDLNITWYASCLVMEPDTYDRVDFKDDDLKHIKKGGRFYLSHCDGRNGEEKNMFAVLCGRPPL